MLSWNLFQAFAYMNVYFIRRFLAENEVSFWTWNIKIQESKSIVFPQSRQSATTLQKIKWKQAY